MLSSSQDIEGKRYLDVNQGPSPWYKCEKNDLLQSKARSCQYQCTYKIWINSTKDIERKQKIMTDEQTDGQTNGRKDRQPKSYIAPPFQSGAIMSKK